MTYIKKCPIKKTGHNCVIVFSIQLSAECSLYVVFFSVWMKRNILRHTLQLTNAFLSCVMRWAFRYLTVLKLFDQCGHCGMLGRMASIIRLRIYRCLIWNTKFSRTFRELVKLWMSTSWALVRICGRYFIQNY